jgi:hypothetical protein
MVGKEERQMPMVIDKPAPGRDLETVGALTNEEMLQQLRARGCEDMRRRLIRLGHSPGQADRIMSEPTPEEQPGGLWEDVAMPQAVTRLRRWENAAREAGHDTYLRFRFPPEPGQGREQGVVYLDAQQEPETLRKWLRSLVAAKQVKGRPSCTQLIAAGNIGTGKTAAVVALGNEAARLGLETHIVKHASYLTMRWDRPGMMPDGMTGYKARRIAVTCDLLILDELCGDMEGGLTPTAIKDTVDLVDARLNSGRPTALTTNCNRAMLLSLLGERFVSRLEQDARLVKIRGEDRRKPNKPLEW